MQRNQVFLQMDYPMGFKIKKIHHRYLFIISNFHQFSPFILQTLYLNFQ